MKVLTITEHDGIVPASQETCDHGRPLKTLEDCPDCKREFEEEEDEPDELERALYAPVGLLCL